MSLLSLQQVRFAFPGWPSTVDGVDLDLEQGAFHCLVGRSGCGKTTLLKLAAGLLRPDAVAYDVIYSPRETPFLIQARQRGLRAEGGLGMLVGQAALSFQIWTGVAAPLHAMRSAAERARDAPIAGP